MVPPPCAISRWSASSPKPTPFAIAVAGRARPVGQGDRDTNGQVQHARWPPHAHRLPGARDRRGDQRRPATAEAYTITAARRRPAGLLDRAAKDARNRIAGTRHPRSATWPRRDRGPLFLQSASEEFGKRPLRDGAVIRSRKCRNPSLPATRRRCPPRKAPEKRGQFGTRPTAKSLIRNYKDGGAAYRTVIRRLNISEYTEICSDTVGSPLRWPQQKQDSKPTPKNVQSEDSSHIRSTDDFAAA